MLEKRLEAFGKMSDMMETSTLNVKYDKKPSTIVELAQITLDVLKGGGSAVYHLAEEAIHVLEDIPATSRALVCMIAHPIDTVKYLSHVVIDSFNRDVIKGDAV